MITIACSKCGKALEIADEFAGHAGTCPACGADVTIPDVAKPQDAAAPPVPPPESPRTQASCPIAPQDGAKSTTPAKMSGSVGTWAKRNPAIAVLSGCGLLLAIGAVGVLVLMIVVGLFLSPDASRAPSPEDTSSGELSELEKARRVQERLESMLRTGGGGSRPPQRSGEYTCSSCNGTGQATTILCRCSGQGTITTASGYVVTCPQCNGTGMGKGPCMACGGSGKTDGNQFGR